MCFKSFKIDNKKYFNQDIRIEETKIGVMMLKIHLCHLPILIKYNKTYNYLLIISCFKL